MKRAVFWSAVPALLILGTVTVWNIAYDRGYKAGEDHGTLAAQEPKASSDLWKDVVLAVKQQEVPPDRWIRNKPWAVPSEEEDEAYLDFAVHQSLRKMPTKKLIRLFASSAAILKERGYTAKQLADALGDPR